VRARRKSKPMVVTIRLAPKAGEMIRALHESGLYGFTVKETVERIVCRELIQMIGDGFLDKLLANAGPWRRRERYHRRTPCRPR